MFYSGIDLHKDNCLITTINDGGELVRQERLPNVPEIILAYFATLGGSHNTVNTRRLLHRFRSTV